jgi:Ras-related protein Rab-18
MSSNNECDYTFRIVIVGDQTVGKTSLLLRFVDNIFIAENVTTNGANMKSRVISCGKKNVQLNIHDTCGQELFRTISRSIYNNADAVIVVYDQGNEKSFNNVQFWLREVDKYSNNPNCHKIIVGNKIDTEKLVVTIDQGKAYATSQGLQFLETSAKTGHNVDTLFSQATQGIGNKVHSSEDWTKVRVERPDAQAGSSSLNNSGKPGKRPRDIVCTLP